MQRDVYTRSWIWHAAFWVGCSMLLLLGGCGGGASLAGGVDSGGTGSITTLAAGPVSGLGSAIVNGVRFDVGTANIVDEDGNILTADQLSLGMVAKIESTTVLTATGQSTATAASVLVRSQLVGSVDSVDLISKSLVVLGQTVQVTPATWFDTSLAGGFASSLVGTVIEVYGQFDLNRNQYVATRIAAHLDHNAYKIAGLVQAVDPAASTLTVGGLVVSYALIAPANVPALMVGDFVRIRLATHAIGGVWRALVVAVGHFDLPDRRDVRIKGRIHGWTSTRSFHLDGIKINAGNALFVGAESSAVVGARVTIKGSSSRGEVTATEVSIDGDETAGNSVFELHGTIDTLDSGLQTLTVHGVTVSYASVTSVQGGAVSDLAIGKKIKVLGVVAPDRSSAVAQSITFE